MENKKTEETPEKFECSTCGCYFWVKDRNDFVCPNCDLNNEMEIKAEKQSNESLDECIKIPIYFRQDEETKEVFIDEDSIYSELKQKLEEIKENPEKFLEIVRGEENAF